VSDLPVLWHIEISNFNEKARWALDYKGIPHVRKAPMPGAHGIYARRLTRGGARTFPVLQLEGQAIGDSTAIIAALEEYQPEPPLYPTDPDELTRALEIEDYFDTEVGSYVRSLSFFHLLQDRDLAIAGINQGENVGRQRMMRAAYPVVRAFMNRDYTITEERAHESRQKIDAALERIVAETGPSGYLVGDSFSVADLTAASILGPFISPPEFPHPITEIPESLQALRGAGRAHPAGVWVTEMYARHRGASVAVPA
jgi:glutathione S-transferase